MIAWYLAQHASVGAWGSIGFALAIVGVLIIRSSGAIPGVELYPPGALLVVVGIDVRPARSLSSSYRREGMAHELLRSFAQSCQFNNSTRRDGQSRERSAAGFLPRRRQLVSADSAASTALMTSADGSRWRSCGAMAIVAETTTLAPCAPSVRSSAWRA